MYEDAAQEVWIRIHEAKDEVVSRNYLISLAKNTIINFLRSQKAQRMRNSPGKDKLIIDGLDEPLESGLTLADILPDEDKYRGLEVAMDYYRVRSIGRKVLRSNAFKALFEPDSLSTMCKRSFFTHRSNGIKHLSKHLTNRKSFNAKSA